MATKVWFVAGISGGHIIPCLTIAKHFKKQFSGCKTFFFSTNAATDNTILEGNELVDMHVSLPLKRTPRSLSQYPRFFMHASISFLISLYKLIRHRPDVIVSTGGLVSIPVCLAGWILRIPIDVYELNAIPGKALTKIAPFATHIYHCFDVSKNYFAHPSVQHIPYPLRHTAADKTMPPALLRTELGLDPLKKTICILGGSQGSLFLNNFIKEWISSPCHNDVQIIHQTGPDDNTDWHAFYDSLNVPAYVFSFKKDISRCYQAADLVICRAGAGTIFEVNFFEKPCILIPLETATTSHQIDNAYAIAKEFPHQFAVLEQDVAEKNKPFSHQLIQTMLNKSFTIKSSSAQSSFIHQTNDV